MDIKTLQQRLEIWKRILFILVGASLTLFLQAILNYQETQSFVFQTSWLVVLRIFSYNMLPPLGLVVMGCAVFLLTIYWRTRKKPAASDEIFP